MVCILVSACGSVQSSSTPDAAVDAGPPDGPARFTPIHLDFALPLAGAPDVVLAANPATIDTTALMIDGATSPFFVKQGAYAVLYANQLSVQHDLTITGTLPLIVVASDRVTVTANIDLSARGTMPGSGAATSGPGAGGAGATFVTTERESSGGGGGSYGSLGGPGGTGDSPRIPAGASGLRYGMLPTDPLVGGSPGGPGGNTAAGGGAGGGALQISSATSISITGNYITAGGGGGTGGGSGLNGGGGGGAGGEIFLEAPSITISATLAANGGGGGGGGAGGSATIATDGGDGTVGDGPAAGGIGGVPQGSPGGQGAAGQSASFMDAQPGSGFNSKGGGGGGGAGRIWLRYRASAPPVTTGARFSPPAGLDPTLP